MREVDLGIKVMAMLFTIPPARPRCGAGGGTRLANAPARQAADGDPRSIDRVEMRAAVGLGNIREVVLLFPYYEPLLSGPSDVSRSTSGKSSVPILLQLIKGNSHLS